MTDVEGRLLRFVGDALGAEVSAEANIFEAGATSLFSIELVMFIEKTFAVELEDTDLELENFASVAAMTRLAERKLASK